MIIFLNTNIHVLRGCTLIIPLKVKNKKSLLLQSHKRSYYPPCSFFHAFNYSQLNSKNVFKNIVMPFVALINTFCEIAMILILTLMKLDYN